VPYLFKAIDNAGRLLIINSLAIVMAILLLRLNNTARKVFIIFAVIVTILALGATIIQSIYQTPKFIEKFKQNQVERYKQKGQEPPPLSMPLAFVVFSAFLNLPRIVCAIIYITGIILFTRPRVKEQFK